MIVIAQGYTDTPVHPSRPTHKPSVHKPARPEHPKPERAHREQGGRQQRKEERQQKRGSHERRSHKSAPEQERTPSFDGDAPVGIPSLGTLPNTYRRH